jgi:Protein of unknown function (DUF2855)
MTTISTTSITTTLQVRKTGLTDHRWVSAPQAELSDGQVRVRVERFSLTANNITYAAMGDAMQYWHFYPSGDEAWGVIPVWGFAVVEQSRCEGVAVGERLWGYWPMGSHAVLTPGKVHAGGFVDGAEHRQQLHPLYNGITRCASDPFYRPDTEDVQALLRPLFITSYLIDDFMADNGCFGAQRLLLSSASSKTAWGTAWCLKQRSGLEVVGLTSARNRAYCESLGCYDRVVVYEDLASLEPTAPAVYVDFAGNARLRHEVHERFTGLTYDCAIGMTHHDAGGGAKGLAGPKAVLFFAPAQVKKRQAEMGPAAFGQALVGSWHRLTQHLAKASPAWLRVEQHHGPTAVVQAYEQVLAGQDPAQVGRVLSL